MLHKTAPRLQWADDVAGAAWRLLPVLLVAGASIQAHYTVKALEARYSVPMPHHYAPQITGGTSRAEFSSNETAFTGYRF